MHQVRSEVHLAEESLGAQDRSELRVQDLDRHPTKRMPLLGEEHASHTAAAQLALDRVVLAKRELQSILKIGHAAMGWDSSNLRARAILRQGRDGQVMLAPAVGRS